MSTSFNRRLPTRAPPPTPIATATGRRSAAVDDETLSRYLESSLKIPKLTLPNINRKSPAKIRFDELINGHFEGGDEFFGEIKEMGVFGVEGDESVEIGKELFEEKEDVGFVGEGVRLEAYRVKMFREKVKKTTTKLEMVAESIAKILSQHVGTQDLSRKFQKACSSIIFRKNGDSDTQRDPHALSIYITGNDHRFCFTSEDSTSFALPKGSILVTIGKQFEELSNSALKSFNGEIFIEQIDDEIAPFFLEFKYTLSGLNDAPEHNSSKSDSDSEPEHNLSRTISIMDQISAMLILLFLYNLLS